MIKTDNYEAHQVVKNFEQGVPSSFYDLASRIDIGVKNKNWKCKVWRLQTGYILLTGLGDLGLGQVGAPQRTNLDFVFGLKS